MVLELRDDTAQKSIFNYLEKKRTCGKSERVIKSVFHLSLRLPFETFFAPAYIYGVTL